MDVFNSLLPSCSFSVLVFFSFLPFSTFDIHRYRPVFSVNLFLVFGFSFSLSVILSLCLPFSLFFCLFFLTVQSANGIITSPSVLDNHQAPPITAFFSQFLSLSPPLVDFLTFFVMSPSIMGLFSTSRFRQATHFAPHPPPLPLSSFFFPPHHFSFCLTSPPSSPYLLCLHLLNIYRSWVHLSRLPFSNPMLPVPWRECETKCV